MPRTCISAPIKLAKMWDTSNFRRWVYNTHHRPWGRCLVLCGFLILSWLLLSHLHGRRRFLQHPRHLETWFVHVANDLVSIFSSNSTDHFWWAGSAKTEMEKEETPTNRYVLADLHLICTSRPGLGLYSHIWVGGVGVAYMCKSKGGSGSICHSEKYVWGPRLRPLLVWQR